MLALGVMIKKIKNICLIVLIFFSTFALIGCTSTEKVAPIRSFNVPVSPKMASSVENCKRYYKKSELHIERNFFYQIYSDYFRILGTKNNKCIVETGYKYILFRSPQQKIELPLNVSRALGRAYHTLITDPDTFYLKSLDYAKTYGNAYDSWDKYTIMNNFMGRTEGSILNGNYSILLRYFGDEDYATSTEN